MVCVFLMGKLAVGRINYEKLERVVKDLIDNPESGLCCLMEMPNFIEVHGGPGEERQYVVDELIVRMGKIVWGHQEKTEKTKGDGVYRIDLDCFLD